MDDKGSNDRTSLQHSNNTNQNDVSKLNDLLDDILNLEDVQQGEHQALIQKGPETDASLDKNKGQDGPNQ